VFDLAISISFGVWDENFEVVPFSNPWLVYRLLNSGRQALLKIVEM
jgi:hypothetical protein